MTTRIKKTIPNDNGNAELDVGEQLDVEQGGVVESFVCIQKSGDIYLLQPLIYGPLRDDAIEQIRPFVYNSKDGFMFLSQDAKGHRFLMGSGPDNLLDLSAYSMLQSEETDILPRWSYLLVPGLDTLNSYYALNTDLSDQVRLTIDQDDFLKELDQHSDASIQSFDDLVAQADILTEGEMAFHQAPVGVKTFRGDFYSAFVPDDHGDKQKKKMLLDFRFLKQCFQEGSPEWSHAFRSVVFHEWVHVNDPSHLVNPKEFHPVFASFVDGIEKNEGAVMDSLEAIDDKNSKFSSSLHKIYRRLYREKHGRYPEKTDPPDIQIYFGDAVIECVYRGMREAKAYIEQFAYMERVGLEKYPDDFVRTQKSSAAGNIDYLNLFFDIPGGEDFIKSFFKPFGDNSEAIGRLLDWSSYKAPFNQRAKRLKALLSIG